MRLYMKYFGIHLRSCMQYKTSFIFTAIGQFLVSFSMFLSITFMFSRFNSVEGFTYSEVLLCYGVITLAFAASECFFRGFDTFSRIILNGEFDRMMVRPKGLVYQILCSKIELTRMGRFLQAVIVFGYVIPFGGIDWTADKILTVIFMILGGFVLFSALFLAYASICFFTTEGLEFLNIFTDGGREFGSYPIAIYGNEILKFFTFAVPLACVQYYPLLYLTGRTDNVFYMLTPVFSTLFAIPVYVFWRFGVRHYKSIGS